jgi:hypothetical protein
MQCKKHRQIKKEGKGINKIANGKKQRKIRKKWVIG